MLNLYTLTKRVRRARNTMSYVEGQKLIVVLENSVRAGWILTSNVIVKKLTDIIHYILVNNYTLRIDKKEKPMYIQVNKRIIESESNVYKFCYSLESKDSRWKLDNLESNLKEKQIEVPRS